MLFNRFFSFQAAEAAHAAELEAAHARSDVRVSIDNSLLRSRFINLHGKEPIVSSHNAYLFDAESGDSVPLSLNIKTNAKFYAFPYTALAGM